MPAKNFLSIQEKEQLQKSLKQEENPGIRERILMFLLLNDGKTYQDIAEFIGCSRRKVAYWCVHGEPNNLESLLDGRTQGNHTKVTDKYIELLLKTIETKPETFGYDFGRWTGKRLAEHLEKETGILLSKSQIVRILKTKKYVYIWAKYSLEDKQNQENREAFKEKLSEYLRIAQKSPKFLQVWFWDECGFSLRVSYGRIWTRKGKRKKVKGQRRRGRVNLMGGLRYSDKKRLCFTIKKGDSETFYEKISKLNEFVKNEWIKLGNEPEKFSEIGPKIVIILDNASFHKKQEIIEKIEKKFPNLKLEYLPAYSPDYNLIELVWHSAKEYIAHREFENQEQLEETVNFLINEGGLTINWSKKIKNKGNAVSAI